MRYRIQESRGRLHVEIAAFVTLLFLFTLLCLASLSHKSVTIDEFQYIPSGLYSLKTGDFSIDPRNPPLMKLAAACLALTSRPEIPLQPQYLGERRGWWPWVYGTRFMRLNQDRYTKIIDRAKLATVITGVLLGATLFLGARRIFGPGAALAALWLFVFDPNMIAHSRVAATDLGLTFLMILAFLGFTAFLSRGKPVLAGASGLACGLAVTAKFTAVLLIPFFMCVYVAKAIFKPRWFQDSRVTIRKSLIHFVCFFIPLFLALNAAYFFQGLFRPLKAMELHSPLLAGIQATFLGDVPVPLPEEMVEGFDDASRYARSPEIPGFFNGRWRPGGSMLYFPQAFLMKSTPGFICLMLGSLFAGLWLKRATYMKGLALLIFPVILGLFLMLGCRINYGIRYLLPIYPFLFLVAAGLARPQMKMLAPGSLFKAGKVKVKIRHALLAALFIWHAVSGLYTYPHYLSYFNFIAGGPDNAHRYFVDSNLDWGQDLPGLKRYMETEGIPKIKLAYYGHADPKLYGIDYELMDAYPRPGNYAASVSFVMGQPYRITYQGYFPQQVSRDRFGWLRAYEPVAKIGYSIWIFKIGEDE
ncbi:ArnT family glycosyltransferase [Acidobacteriota bacterium]